MGVRHHHGHQGAAAAGAGTGDIMGRLAWRHGRSRAPFRPWRAVHQPRVHHQGRGIRHASLDRHGRRLVRQRHGRERQRRVQDRARLATQALPGFEGPGIGDVPVGLVVELEASAPVLGLQDTGTDRNRVLCKPSGASRPTIRAEQKSGHIRELVNRHKESDAVQYSCSIIRGWGETSLDDEQILVLDLLKKLLPKMGQDEVSAVSFFLNRQIDGEKTTITAKT